MANALSWLPRHSLFGKWWSNSTLKHIFRGEGPQSEPIELNRKRIFILPTRHGLFFAVVLFAMLIGAINYNNSLAYMLTFLLASMAMVSMFHTHRNLAGLVFRAGHSDPVFAGQQATFEIHIDHRDHSNRYSISLEIRGQSPVIVDIPEHQTTDVWVEMPTNLRGYLNPGNITVHTRYPLGIFRAWSNVNLDMRCLVYPKPAPRGRLPWQSPRRLSNEGDQGRGADDFIGFRTYHPGDSLRHVNWKAVAREQEMLTKQFGGDRVEELWLDWETLQTLDLESRLQQLCRWVLDADEQFLHYGLRIPGKTIAPGSSTEHRKACLESLALFTTEKDAEPSIAK